MCGAVKNKNARSRRLLAVLTEAMLAICLFHGSAQAAGAGQIPATRAVAAKPATSVAIQAAAEQPPAVPRERVYLFRGALGPIFSRGMDSLQEQIERAGVTANVYEFTICDLIIKRAIEQYRQDPVPIVLIGHSMGGRCGLMFAEALEAENIPVSLLVTIDPAHMSPSVPLNVERFINIFLSKDVLGGGDIKPRQGFQGHYASVDLAQRDEVSHISIDKLDTVHQQLMTKIMELAVTPAKAEGEAIQIRYVVPPKVPIELWDSGTAVFARPGDTLQTLAEFYHVPLWSLTQINRMQDNTPLSVGERVVVPRHLTPLTAAANPQPSQR
jgi:hypothetical protein